MIQKRILVTGTTARTARYLSLYCSVQGLRIYGVKISKMPTADLTLGRGPDRDNAQRPAQRDPGGDGLGAHLFQFHVGSGSQCGARSVGAGREQLGDLVLYQSSD